MTRLNDPVVLALPHPVRFRAVGDAPTDTALFEEVGVMAQLRPWLTDAGASTEWILNNVPGVRDMALAWSGAPET